MFGMTRDEKNAAARRYPLNPTQMLWIAQVGPKAFEAQVYTEDPSSPGQAGRTWVGGGTWHPLDATSWDEAVHAAGVDPSTAWV